jgi:SAM-dependent methyltransferase
MASYYRRSGEYAEMLGRQDEAVFDPYLARFARWAPRGSRVLDVGCGVGTSTRKLRRRGFEAVGVDVSERFLPDEPWFHALDFQDAEAIPDRSFAAAGALNVLEHVPDPRRFLHHLVRVVEPGGHVVLASPNLTSPLVGARALLDLAGGRTPYLGLGRRRSAVVLIARNAYRSARIAAGAERFEPRTPTLESGIVGYDVDAVYWTNAHEVRRALERLGAEVVEYQTEARGRVARGLARTLPSLAGQLLVVARRRR